MIKLLSLSLAFLFLSTATTQAEEFPGGDFFGDETFYEGVGGGVIISATKMPKRLVTAPAIATVIYADQIRNMGARTLIDVLQRMPGIVILSDKDLGDGIGSIVVRGIGTFFSEKILLMIDGHRIFDLTSGGGTVLFDDMMVENIKRVEVIRGPGSALHGANAFVASINVVTLEPSEVDGVEVLAGGGSFGTRHANLLFGNKISKLKITGFFDYLGNDSPDLQVDQDAIGRSGQTDNWRRKIDFGLKVSQGKFTFNSRYMSKKGGPTLGPANVLTDEGERETRYFFGELAYQSAIAEKWHVLSQIYVDWFALNFNWEIAC